MGDLGLNDRNSSQALWPTERLVHSFHCTSGGLHSLRVTSVMWVTLKEGLWFGKGTRVEVRREEGQVFSKERR